MGVASAAESDDVIDPGPGQPGVLKILSQSGKKFHRRQERAVVISDSVDELKSDSRRVLVVPVPLMDLIRVIIRVFHTEKDGTVRADARLVPGLGKDDRAGQSALRRALQLAAPAEHIGIRDELNRISSTSSGSSDTNCATRHP